MPRKLDVQTPGAPAPEADSPQVSQQTENPAQAAPEIPAEPEKKQRKEAQAKAPVNYREMRAEDIDPAALTAPVLSRDGWVMPLGNAVKHPAARS